jgi:RimJ/RimL family protein N-acetyltransferase
MPFELQPELEGELVIVRPIRPGDWNDLFAVAADPLIWEQHPASDRYKEDVFKVFFGEALECGGGLVALDKSTRQIIGSTRFYGYDPERSEIEIGWTFLARRYWGGRYNGEMKRLMLDHAFKFVDTVVFYVGQNNTRSRNALERIGASYAGLVEKNDNFGAVSVAKYVIKRSR